MDPLNNKNKNMFGRNKKQNKTVRFMLQGGLQGRDRDIGGIPAEEKKTRRKGPKKGLKKGPKKGPKKGSRSDKPSVNSLSKTLKKKVKKEACSPYAKSKNSIKGSCFTDGNLVDLKNTFNRKHPEDSIQTEDPVQIWTELAEKTREEYQCNKESCWVNHLADSTNKTKLKSLLFAPPQPSEWKKNPITWLSNFDILHVLKQYEQTYPQFFFIGPSPIDYNYKEYGGRCVCPNLCQFDLQKQYSAGKRKIGVIFNLDPHHKSGSHWVSLFIDLEDQFVFYFDSTSDPIPKLINGFATNVIHQGRNMNPVMDLAFHQNNKIEHQKKNTECGMYSLFFIITMLIREKNGRKLNKDDLFTLFKGGKRIPDDKMQKLRGVFFNKTLEGGGKKR